VDGDGIEEARRHLAATFPTATGDFFECDETEAAAAFATATPSAADRCATAPYTPKPLRSSSPSIC
jgi:hypothetical protein